MSVCEVTRTALMDRNMPRGGGINDTRLGTIHHATCATCRNPVLTCPGHFGHIELAEAVFHPLHVETVMKLLRCVCFWCSRCLVDVPSGPRDGVPLLTAVVNAAMSGGTCRPGGGAVPRVRRWGCG